MEEWPVSEVTLGIDLAIVLSIPLILALLELMLQINGGYSILLNKCVTQDQKIALFWGLFLLLQRAEAFSRNKGAHLAHQNMMTIIELLFKHFKEFSGQICLALLNLFLEHTKNLPQKWSREMASKKGPT